jgi:hypothetical protein
LVASPYLLIDAWTTPVKLRYLDANYPSRFGDFTAIMRDQAEAWPFIFISPMQAIEKLTANEVEDIESRIYIGIIVVRRVIANPDHPFVLVAEEKERFMERVGNLFLGKTGVHPMPGDAGKDREGWDIGCLSWK